VTMSDEQEELTLDNIGGGVATELFAEELGKVLGNILDVNTSAKAKRAITLTATFSPMKGRDEVLVTVEVKSKLAAPTGAAATIFVGMRKGRAVAVEHDPRQLQIRWDEESKPKSLDEKRAAAGE